MRAHDAELVSAAEAHFGSWGMALYVTGIDPNLYFVHGATGEGAIKIKRPRPWLSAITDSRE